MTNNTATSIIIVGGGPLGLTMGIELARRGINCILVEARDGTVNTPKMNFVNIRSMEFCRRWGLVDSVRIAGLCNECAHTVELDIDELIGTAANIVWNFNYGPKIKSRSEWYPKG